MKSKLISNANYERLIRVKSQIPAHLNFEDRRSYALERLKEIFFEPEKIEEIILVLAHYCAIRTAPITEDVSQHLLGDFFYEKGL